MEPKKRKSIKCTYCGKINSKEAIKCSYGYYFDKAEYKKKLEEEERAKEALKYSIDDPKSLV